MLTAAYINSCGWVPRAQLLTAEAGCRELVQLASRVASNTSFNGFYRPRALAPEPRISGASRCSYGIRQSRAAVSRASLCLHPPNIQPRCHGPASVYIPRIYSRSVTGQPLPAGSGIWKSQLLDDLTRYGQISSGPYIYAAPEPGDSCAPLELPRRIARLASQGRTPRGRTPPALATTAPCPSLHTRRAAEAAGLQL